VALVIATTLAYGLDYLFNLLAGRLLEPADFGIVVSLAAAGQVMVVASRVIQTVTTRYIARYQAGTNAEEQIKAFFRSAFRSAWWWGLAATAILALLSRPLGNFLQIPNTGPVLALIITTILFTLRPVVGGVLQGQQRFAALGNIQIIQAAVRLGAGVLLMTIGLGAFGAMAALPIAVGGALVYGLLLLRQQMWGPTEAAESISYSDLFRYSAYTAAGLIGYALLVNMDAILVKRFFDPVEAGHYGAAVTLGKIIQFFPLAIIMILFPKAAQRKAAQRNSAGILVAALLFVGLVCGGLTAVYFLFQDFLITTIFGPAYQLQGPVLGLLGLAMTLLSVVNVWMNYFLSTERTHFVALIWLGVIVQLLIMVLFHRELYHLPLAVVINSLWLALAFLVLRLVKGRQ
jgi:O-antigen/teichoic acid export membrane protein